jgi:lipopolysaccharide/colanic/teichoic acid biosynthesis glycosyltransferase
MTIGLSPERARGHAGIVEETTPRIGVPSFEPPHDFDDDANGVIDIVPRTRSEQINRLFNLIVSAIALAVLSPLFLMIAVAIKLSSRGPIFYMQTRIGIDRRWNRTRNIHERRMQDLGGAVFMIYKFRTMYVDAERRSGAVWATKNDPRVTTVGRILRQLRLDELPQLINVFNGDMNIVGPRPERPSIFLRLRREIPAYPLRQRAKPGITGWAQINNAYDATLDDVRRKVQLDIEYLQRQSLWEDIGIMLKTVPVMIFRRGSW